MAETRYQLGLACTFDKRYDPAVAHYRVAIAIIEAKIKQLSRVVAGEIPPSSDVDPHGFDTPQQLAKKEMDELAEIIPDILAKVLSFLCFYCGHIFVSIALEKSLCF